MRYLSVCSGIEAATVAWHPLGWTPIAFAEIERFPSAVLAHRYPHVPNWGDLTRYKDWPDATLDLLVGGTPCQSFSVAGLRAGLADPRGNIALTFPDAITAPEDVYIGNPENDRVLVTAMTSAALVIAAWGFHRPAQPRALVVRRMADRLGVSLSCLGRTLDGHPRHPLYLKAITTPEPFPFVDTEAP